MLLADKSGAGWLGKMWFISYRALNSSVIEILQIFYENISIGQCFLFIKEIFSYSKNLSKLNLKKNAQAAWPNVCRALQGIVIPTEAFGYY